MSPQYSLRAFSRNPLRKVENGYIIINVNDNIKLKINTIKLIEYLD